VAAHDPDATADAPPIMASPCESDPALLLCFSFDQATLPASLPNEGSVSVAAQLTNVTSIASPSGHAARIDTTSEIFVPYASAAVGMLSMEMWFRVDTDPADGTRAGLFDNAIGPDGMSLFLYRQDPGPHMIRCTFSGETIYFNAPGYTVGDWHHAACVCDATTMTMTMYLDGASIGSNPGTCAPGGDLYDTVGLTIGQNNNNVPGTPAPVDNWLVGAIDGVKLWNVTLTAQQVRSHAGLAGYSPSQR
jgi:hypothetical protein